MATEFAPIQTVFDHNGRPLALAELYRSGPVALVFLRHLGCLFCQEQVLALNSHSDLSLWFVAMATPPEVNEYRTKLASPHGFLCDPGEDLYREMGLRDATPRQVFTPLMFRRAIGGALRGRFNHRSSANMARMGGAFLVGTDGRILWRRPATQVADIIGGDEIRDALTRAESGFGREGEPGLSDLGIPN